ncbi:MAG: hypothetical protein WBN83_10900 [Desulfoprunum sp.]|uniref:hypothetical protein n=1 Tax=Desulfoprunum sp. TaxID=2020866 RepID=UPI003C79298D
MELQTGKNDEDAGEYHETGAKLFESDRKIQEKYQRQNYNTVHAECFRDVKLEGDKDSLAGHAGKEHHLDRLHDRAGIFFLEHHPPENSLKKDQAGKIKNDRGNCCQAFDHPASIADAYGVTCNEYKYGLGCR